jgi:lysophospholipase L1-like esterase
LEISTKPDSFVEQRSTVFIASDSTAQTYSSAYYPQAGWGQFINDNFTNDVLFNNRAIGGRSSKSYIVEGSFDTILSKMKANDYLLVQFGHNDASTIPERHTDAATDFKTYLRQYVDKTREHNSFPILITPVGRRSYDANGVFKNDFPAYCNSIKEVAAEKNVPMIDLMQKSIAYYNTIGIEGSKSVFLNLPAGVYTNFPNGVQDNTHFQEYGAKQISKIVADSIKKLNLPISKYVK